MKVGTFFSGVGSPEQALRNLGIKHEIEFACDIDKYAKETYLKNFKPKLYAEDITTLDMKDLPYVDLLVFGFPCQAFSLAGKRQGFDDTRGTLFYDALRYLKEHKPRYFIAENVKGLLSHDNNKTFQTIIDCLAKTTNYQMSLMPFENLGYHIHYKVLNTKDFGIPQNRERIFIIGIRDDKDNNFNFPKEIPLELKLKDMLQDNPNSKYYLSEEQQKRLLERTEVDIKNVDEPTCLDVYNKKLVKDTSICLTEPHHNNLRLVVQNIKIPSATKCGYEIAREGDSIRMAHIGSKTGRGRVGTKQSQALVVAGDMHTLTKSGIRRLTPMECERLQGFPDNFTEGVSDTQRYKQMGNTITVNVIQAILKNLLK
jgi:DNA (cytosine-5)-methyltransferase 1